MKKALRSRTVLNTRLALLTVDLSTPVALA